MSADLGGSTRLATPDDLESIGSLLPDLAGPLFPERFPGQTAAGFCRWKYFQNPLGAAAVGVVTDGPRVVSLAAGVPKQVRVGSQILTVFELGDFITAPEYRKRGLFSSLINLVCGEARKRGAAFVYVRPNESSFRILTEGLLFLEAHQIEERRYVTPSSAIHSKMGVAPAVTRALGADWVAFKRAVPVSAKSVTVAQVPRFGPEMEDLWNKASGQYSFVLVRDTRYLNWRYADCPTPFQLWTAYCDGNPTGYAITFTQQVQPVGYIVDLFAAPEDARTAATLLRTVMEAMFAKGVQRVYTWIPHSDTASAGVKLLKRVCPLMNAPYLHMAMRFLDGQTNISSLPQRGWHLAPGDFDGI